MARSTTHVRLYTEQIGTWLRQRAQSQKRTRFKGMLTVAEDVVGERQNLKALFGRLDADAAIPRSQVNDVRCLDLATCA